jgi:hypothetical protein
MSSLITRLALLALAMPLAAGCVGTPRPGAPSATAADPHTAEPDFWLAQPAVAHVTAADPARLWDACEDVARRTMFQIDRRDYRAGILTTYPTVSKQAFELWRSDAGTFADACEASLATIRRTIHFQFAQNPDGTHTVSPKVVVERRVMLEARHRADPETPAVYWYALRRDQAMEEQLAESIQKRLDAF